jgi:hypothetical protein
MSNTYCFNINSKSTMVHPVVVVVVVVVLIDGGGVGGCRATMGRHNCHPDTECTTLGCCGSGDERGRGSLPLVVDVDMDLDDGTVVVICISHDQ